jgi:hypothetical protein
MSRPPSSGRAVARPAPPLPSASSYENENDSDSEDQQETVELRAEHMVAEHRRKYQARERALAAGEGPDPITDPIKRDDLNQALVDERPYAPTLPFVPTPPVEWEVQQPPTPGVETSLNNQIWSGLRTTPLPDPRSSVSSRVQQAHPPPQPAPGAQSSGSFPAAATGASQVFAVPPPPPVPAKADDGLPLIYVVASAFFLAIAVVGFGLYLAYEVISL